MTPRPQKPNTLILKRPNETNAPVPGNRKLLVMDRKLYAAMMLFTQNQTESLVSRAFASDLQQIAGLEKSRRDEVKASIERLRNTTVWIEHNGKEHLVGMIELPALAVEGRGASSIVEWQFHPLIRERVINPINLYTRQHLKEITKLRLGASIALYEICSQYVTWKNPKTQKVGYTGKREIQQWIDQLLGDRRKKDYLYSELYRIHIKKAIEEINSETNLIVEMLPPTKEGKRVTHLEFYVKYKVSESPEAGDGKENDRPELTDNSPSIQIDPEIYALLEGVGVKKSTIARILEQYSEPDYIKKHVAQMATKINNGFPVRDPNAYLLAALRDDYEDKPAELKRNSAAEKPFINFDLLLAEFSNLKKETQLELQRQWFSQLSNTMKGVVRGLTVEDATVKEPFFTWYQDVHEGLTDQLDCSPTV